jgi:SHS2 domain-containing protein
MTEESAAPGATPERGGPDASGATGHRSVRHKADYTIEAWAPDRAACLVEALCALVEGFAHVPDAPASRVLALVAAQGGAEDELVSLLEDVILAADVFSVFPLRFHLTETEGGGIAGDMEVVPIDQVTGNGPFPKSVSFHHLSMTGDEGGWRCHVVIGV